MKYTSTKGVGAGSGASGRSARRRVKIATKRRAKRQQTIPYFGIV